MERARSVISDTDLRPRRGELKGGGKEGEDGKGERRKRGIGSNQADGQERNFFSRTAAAEQRTRDIKEEFCGAHVAPVREKRVREREGEGERAKEKEKIGD